MEVLHPLCAGLDVHKDIIVACRRHAKGNTVRQDVESFEATTRGLLELAAWIGEWEITASTRL
jgi:transposase